MGFLLSKARLAGQFFLARLSGPRGPLQNAEHYVRAFTLIESDLQSIFQAMNVGLLNEIRLLHASPVARKLAFWRVWSYA
jgi:hypothetical protein